MPEPRCYTIAVILEKLQMSKTTFKRLRKAGQLPFLEELQPRLGGTPRYRAELVDRYLGGQWGQSTHFASHRRSA
jgi:hypothetical protein